MYGSKEAEEAIVDWLEASEDDDTEEASSQDESQAKHQNKLVDFPDFCEMVRTSCPSREVSFDEIDSAFRSIASVPGQSGVVLLEHARRVVTERFRLNATARGDNTNNNAVKTLTAVNQTKSDMHKTSEQAHEREAHLSYLDEQEKQILSAIMREDPISGEDASENTTISNALSSVDEDPYSDFAALLQPKSTAVSGEAVEVEEAVPHGINFAEFCELVREQMPEKEIAYEEIQGMFHQMDANGDGMIVQEEFEKAIADGSLFGAVRPNTSNSGDNDEHLSEADSDSEKMDAIDFAEFCELVREQMPEKEITYEQIQGMFRQMDTNGDGTIDQGEFEKAIADGVLFGNTVDNASVAVAGKDYAESLVIAEEAQVEDPGEWMENVKTEVSQTSDVNAEDNELAANDRRSDGMVTTGDASRHTSGITEEAQVEDLSEWMENVKTEVSQTSEVNAEDNETSSSEENDEVGENVVKADSKPNDNVSKVQGIMRKVFDRADTNRSGTLTHDEVC